MPLGLFPRETADALSLMPGEADTSAAPTPAWYAGIPSAIGLGIEHGATAGVMAIMPAGDQAVRGMNLPASAYEVHEIDPEEYQRNLARDEAEVLASMKPNPRLVGTAGQVLHGLASGLTRIVPGAAVGGPLGGAIAVGGSEGLATRNELETAGVDMNTANALGAGSALFAGAGALLPGGFGMTLAQRIATGAAAQTEMGIVSRGMMSSVLDQAGYAEQARAYVPFDGMAMMADAVLGAGFGAVHHAFAPSTVDAARVVKDAEHVERAPPGIPTDGASRQAALDAVDAHVEALIRGDDTPPPTGDVRYVTDPAQEAAREAAAREVQDAAAEVGASRVDVPVQPRTPTDIMAETQARVEAEPPTPPKAEGDPLAELDPEVREALDQAQAVLRDNPDLKVAGEGGEAVNAADALRRAVDEVRQSAGDEELHRVAAACFGRA